MNPKPQVISFVCSEGIIRIDQDEDAKTRALPSFSFTNPDLRDSLLVPPNQPVAKSYDVSFDEEGNCTKTLLPDKAMQGIVKEQPKAPFDIKFSHVPKESEDNFSISITIDTNPDASFYGTGEVAGRLRRNGTTIETWNTDAYYYSDESTSLYQSHPWIFVVLPDGISYGILADTSYRCRISIDTDRDNFPGRINILAEGEPFPILCFLGPTPEEVLVRLAKAVGTIPMPPMWSIGYHQCRWSYYPQDKVREIVRGFREREIPLDVIWLDIDYMDGFRCFTWSPEHFPDPRGLLDYIHEHAVKCICMIDPGIKADPKYFVYKQGRDIDAFVKDKNGKQYKGRVWPGKCAFPDFTNETCRKWWAGLYKNFLSDGIDGIWNDMNEPSVFSNVKGNGSTMPVDNIHQADDIFGGAASHDRFHNVYGMLMARSSYEGITEANPTKRCFLLTRSGFIGSHRYAAMWTGDNRATWEHLGYSIPMILNLGLSGQPFSGPDIGGFFSGEEDSGELFGRWMGIGAMMPFARGHCSKKSPPKEPWCFGEEVEMICKHAIGRRYRLLPYLYTLFWKAHSTGLPVARPVFFSDPSDRVLRSHEHSFLLGKDLLIGCALWKEDSPADLTQTKSFSGWRKFNFDDEHKELPDMFIRPGAIIPSIEVIQSTESYTENIDITLLICLDQQGKAEGTLYEDLGDGYEFLNGGYREIVYSADTISPDHLVVRSIVHSGNMQVDASRKLHVRLLLEDGREVYASEFHGIDFQMHL